MAMLTAPSIIIVYESPFNVLLPLNAKAILKKNAIRNHPLILCISFNEKNANNKMQIAARLKKILEIFLE